MQCIEFEGLKDDNKIMKGDIQRITQDLSVSEKNNCLFKEQIQQLKEVI